MLVATLELSLLSLVAANKFPVDTSHWVTVTIDIPVTEIVHLEGSIADDLDWSFAWMCVPIIHKLWQVVIMLELFEL